MSELSVNNNNRHGNWLIFGRFYSAKIPIIQKQQKASVHAGLLKINLQNSGNTAGAGIRFSWSAYEQIDQVTLDAIINNAAASVFWR
jgi:hypothetical protein